MAKYHINPSTGDAGTCSAQKGNCPFGGDEVHFTSAEAAREASEEILAKNFGGGALVKRSLQELNSLAKDTADNEVIANIIANGSERTLNNLAQNPNLSDAQAKEALDKATTPRVRAMLMMRGKGSDFSSMTPADYEEIVFQQAKKGFSSQLARGYVLNPHVTDEAFKEVMASSRIKDRDKSPIVMQTLAEPNKITPKLFAEELAKNGWRNYPINGAIALSSGKLTEETLKSAPKEYLENFGSAGLYKVGADELDVLADVATNRGVTRLAQKVAQKDETSALSLSKLAHSSLSEDVDETIYKHKNASEYTKNEIAERYPTKPFVRIGKLRATHGDAEIDSLITSRGGSQLGRAYSETRLTFDMDKVRKLGLTNDDIFYLGNARGYNAGGGFNPETGVLTMRVDSSD